MKDTGRLFLLLECYAQTKKYIGHGHVHTTYFNHASSKSSYITKISIDVDEVEWGGGEGRINTLYMVLSSFEQEGQDLSLQSRYS